MNNEIRKTYYEGRCNRLHDLFLHYSTVRIVILSFLIPLGGVMIIQGKHWAGIWVILAAWGLNFYFGRMSIRRWLEHQNIDLWLRIGNTTHEFEDEYKEEQLAYLQVLLWCKLPEENTFRDPIGLDKQWREEWGKVLIRASKPERWIQFFILVGIVAFVFLLLYGCSSLCQILIFLVGVLCLLLTFARPKSRLETALDRGRTKISNCEESFKKS